MVSHDTALAVHELSDVMPARVHLAEREQQVLVRVIEGKTDARIAGGLEISAGIRFLTTEAGRFVLRVLYIECPQGTSITHHVATLAGL